MTEQTPQKPQPKRQPRAKQARKPDGKFEAGVEPTPVENATPKKVDHTVKPKVKPSGSGGKYAPKPKVRPGIGRVTSTLR